jgi:hypothetical protein
VALIVSSHHALFVGDWSTGTVYRIAKASAANANT